MTATTNNAKDASVRQEHAHRRCPSAGDQSPAGTKAWPPEAVAARWDGFFLEARRLAALSRERQQKISLPE